MKSYLRILNYLRPFWLNVLSSLLFNLLSTLFGLFSFLMIVPFLEVLFGTQNPVTVDPGLHFSPDGIAAYFNYRLSELILSEGKGAGLIFICALIIFSSFFKNFFRYLSVWAMSPARNGVSRDIRNDLFYKLLALPLAYFSEEKKGNLMTRMSNDVQEVENSILNTLEVVFKDPLSILVYLGTLFYISPGFTLYALGLLLITALIIGRIGRKLKMAAQRGQALLSNLASILEESLTGMRIIKAFNAEERVKALFRNENNRYYRIMTSLIRKRDLSSPLTEFLATLVIAAVLFLGGQQVIHGELSASLFIGYLVVFSQLINPFKNFSKAFFQIQKGMASAERIAEVLDENIAITEKNNALPVKSFNEAISYQNVSFSYGDDPVLKDINLDIKKGKMLAIVGPSGAGKSTLADLLPRFFDVSSGSLRIDGHDIRDLKISDLRHLMGIVSQEPILFNDSIHNNIAFGKEGASKEEVIEAAKIANAHEFIIKMPDAYESNVGEAGVKLSGGQRQRLTIARAILKNPPILILDEATSSLDSESEKLVQEALFKLMKNRTSLVIAHRLSTIQFADEIVVMQEGRIIERGNHISLMSKNGLYRKLVEMQAF